MPSEKHTSLVRLSIVIGLVAIVVLLVTFFFTSESGFLRTQAYIPSQEGELVSQGTGYCGPVRKIAYVELREVHHTLQSCIVSQQQECRAAGKTFAAAENVRFGEAYPDDSQDVYWD